MNFCMCGAQAGYPHDPLCPFPLFRGSGEQEQDWRAAWRRNYSGLAPERIAPEDAAALDTRGAPVVE